MNVLDQTKTIREAVAAFTKPMIDSEPDYNGVDWMPRYTKSPSYLRYLGQFHVQNAVVEFMDWLLETIPQDALVYDVGCVCGYTGLVLAMNGYDVAFHDYEGLGLQFVREFGSAHGLPVTVIPYGMPAPMRDWAIALDVIEHTPNQLGFIRWMTELGRTVVFSFPGTYYVAPFKPQLDRWVDAEAIGWVLERRYDIIKHHVADMRTYWVF